MAYSQSKTTESMIGIGKEYFVFGLAMLLLQFVGYNIATLGLLCLCMLPMMSINILLDNIKTIPLYFIFLSLSLVIGIYFALCDGLEIWKIMYWGQFYFFTFTFMAVRDQLRVLTVLKYCVFIIFFADIFTNLLLLIGLDVPWSYLPPVRVGEKMSRFAGIKGNTLYSGSISFIALCFMLQEDLKKKGLKYLCVFAIVFNLILSGSYRYFIVAIVVFCVYYLHLYRHRLLLFATYIGSILIVYFATSITRFISLSNFFRYNIWNYFFHQITTSPLIGHGWYNIHLDNNQVFSWTHLAANGVTESCIILMAFCFGIPMLLLYLSSIIKTLYNFKTYSKYMAELGLFIGLTLDLFWGGSLDNSLSLSVLTLSWYIINRHAFVVRAIQNNVADE